MPAASAPISGRAEYSRSARTPPTVLGPMSALVGVFAWQWWHSPDGRADPDMVLAALLVATTIACFQALRCGATWDELQQAAGQKLATVFPILLILLSIGILIGTWVASGTIPLMIWLGLTLVDPQYFVVTAFAATASMSLCTGTSWGSSATMGVALMAAARALDVPLDACAGAVISGAYFGDKLSPISDSTNICAIGARVSLSDHIRGMLATSIPAMLCACLVYLWVDSELSMARHTADSSRLLEDIADTFAPSPWALVPIAAVALGIVRRWPPAPAMLAASTAACGVAHFTYDIDLAEAIAAGISGFRVSMVPASTGDVALNTLTIQILERGGMWSMAPTIPIIIVAFTLAGALHVSGALTRTLHGLVRLVHNALGLIAATLTAGATMIALTSHGGVSALVVGELFQSSFAHRRLAPTNLSRCLEESITVVEPLLPWTVSAVYMASTLQVSCASYAGWAIFCWASPLFSLALALIDHWSGRGLSRVHGHGDERFEPGSRNPQMSVSPSQPTPQITAQPTSPANSQP